MPPPSLQDVPPKKFSRLEQPKEWQKEQQKGSPAKELQQKILAATAEFGIKNLTGIAASAVRTMTTLQIGTAEAVGAATNIGAAAAGLFMAVEEVPIC